MPGSKGHQSDSDDATPVSYLKLVRGFVNLKFIQKTKL